MKILTGNRNERKEEVTLERQKMTANRDIEGKTSTLVGAFLCNVSIPVEERAVEAIRLLLNGKTPEVDLITAEMLQADVPPATNVLTPLTLAIGISICQYVSRLVS
ncbi:hypothetical protein ACJJTC_013938 [Scirpophaga incertulas]